LKDKHWREKRAFCCDKKAANKGLAKAIRRWFSSANSGGTRLQLDDSCRALMGIEIALN